MLRRWSVGVALSIAVHVAAVGGVVAWSWWRGATPSALDVDITGMRMEELKDLPLGAAPGGGRARASASAESKERVGTLATREEHAPPRAGAHEEVDEGVDEGGPGPTDLRQLGPEG
jgi:hypothetical protein